MNTMTRQAKTQKTLASQQNTESSCAHVHALSLSIKLKQGSGLSASAPLEQGAGESAKALRRAALAVESGSITFRQFDIVSRLLFWEGSHEALAKSLGVSISTLRRDIRELDQAGFVARVYSPQLQRVVPLVRIVECEVETSPAPSEPPPKAEPPQEFPKQPEPLPPSYEHTAEVSREWRAALDEHAPGWQSIGLTKAAKRRLEALCENNRPNDLTPEAWARVSRANFPPVYLGYLCDDKGEIKPESRVAKRKERISYAANPRPINEPTPSIEVATTVPAPAPSTEEREKATQKGIASFRSFRTALEGA